MQPSHSRVAAIASAISSLTLTASALDHHRALLRRVAGDHLRDAFAQPARRLEELLCRLMGAEHVFLLDLAVSAFSFRAASAQPKPRHRSVPDRSYATETGLEPLACSRSTSPPDGEAGTVQLLYRYRGGSARTPRLGCSD
jgi:hypothetical protein